MRTSKPQKPRAAKIAFKILAVLIGAALLNAAITFALEPYGSKSRVIWEDYAAMQQGGETVDTLFVGTSFVHNGIDPHTFDAVYGSSSFNLSSPSQHLEESFIAIQTAYEDFGIKRVVMNVSSNELRVPGANNPNSVFLRERSQAVGWPAAAATIASQVFKPDVLSSSASLNWMFPWIYSHVDPNLSSISQNLQLRFANTSAVEAAYVQDSTWTHVGRGWGSYDTLYNPDEDLSFYFTSDFVEGGDQSFNADRVRTLHEVCDYCSGNGIDLVVVCMPMAQNNIDYCGSAYFTQHDMIAGILAEHDVPYYDFNLAKPEVFDVQPEYFADYIHLNGTGAKAFSAALGAFLADPKDPDDPSAFYSEEEYWNTRTGISGLIVYPETADGGTHVTCRGLTGPKDADRVEYRMLLRDQDGAWQCVRDWDADSDYLYERTEHGMFEIRVEARLADASGADGADNGYFERYRELSLYY